MLVKEACANLSCHLISASHLWEHRVERISATELSAFIRSHWGTPNYYESIRQVERLIDAGWSAFIDRKIRKTPPMIKFDPEPKQRITVDELVAWLSEASEVRRRAILFALETKMPIADVIELTWPRLNMIKHQIPGYALKLAHSTPRHIRLNYVFWENMQGMIAGPLFGLAETVLEVSQGLGYEALQRLYDTTIPIDTNADFEDFANQFCIELNARLLESE